MEFDVGLIVRNAPVLLEGLWITLAALGMSLAIGVPIGLVLCGFKLGGGQAARRFAGGYVTVFRTIPEMVLIFWMFYCLPSITGQRVSGLFAGSLALGLVAGAYLCEIFRAGVQSVGSGQWEAARALSLPRSALWLRVIVPQAGRLAIPPLINLLTELLKGTTLLATIGVADLALKAYVLGAQTFRYFEFLTAIAIAYFIVIFPIARFAARVERRLQQTTA